MGKPKSMLNNYARKSNLNFEPNLIMKKKLKSRKERLTT